MISFRGGSGAVERMRDGMVAGCGRARGRLQILDKSLSWRKINTPMGLLDRAAGRAEATAGWG
jgi:hypothetical protein